MDNGAITQARKELVQSIKIIPDMAEKSKNQVRNYGNLNLLELRISLHSIQIYKTNQRIIKEESYWKKKKNLHGNKMTFKDSFSISLWFLFWFQQIYIVCWYCIILYFLIFSNKVTSVLQVVKMEIIG